MANDSSTPGYLLPTPDPHPLEGQELYRFVQQVVVGITGLDGPMVRPRWQAEPANIPDAGVAWCAVGIMSRPADTFPQVIHNPAGNGSDTVQRQERLDIQASFYDLGTSGLADNYAHLLREGFAIPQNRDVMIQAGFVLAYMGDTIPAPMVLKTRWNYRVDLNFSFRRQIDRTYAVLSLQSAHGILYAETSNDETLDSPLSVEPPPAS
jgi:hypothetical protein